MSLSPSPGPGARVLIVAKAPRPGHSKTRLAGLLGSERAASLQRAMLLDVLDGCRAEVPRTGLLCADPDQAAALASLCGPDAWIVAQFGNGLTDALRSGLAAGLADGDAVALVSADIPGVPAGALTRAFCALGEGVDVVLGPAADGGYWLVALGAPHDSLFEAIPWSTPDVLERTLARCATLGLRAELVQRWRDLDTPADLTEARDRLATLPGARTRAFLAALPAAPGDAVTPERI